MCSEYTAHHATVGIHCGRRVRCRSRRELHVAHTAGPHCIVRYHVVPCYRLTGPVPERWVKVSGNRCVPCDLPPSTRVNTLHWASDGLVEVLMKSWQIVEIYIYMRNTSRVTWTHFKWQSMKCSWRHDLVSTRLEFKKRWWLNEVRTQLNS